MNYQILDELLKRNNNVTIFHHVRPDYDADGSSYALKNLIENNYPENIVYVYQNDKMESSLFEYDQQPSENFIKDSLVIILDCSTNSRIDGDNWQIGKEIIKIDHHLDSEVVSDYMIVEPKETSTCTIIAKIAFELKWKISQKAASYLYAGIVTDTQNLTISSVNSETFNIVSKLCETEFDLPAIQRACYDTTIEQFKGLNYFMSKTIFINDTAYVYCYNEDIKKLGLTDKKCKDYIDNLGKISGINKYAVFAQDENGVFSASLRSRKNSIVEIAKAFGGGGHRLACGISGLDEEGTKTVLEMLLKA